MYNHLMHKLETLSGKVTFDKGIESGDWESVFSLYRRQVFAELYNTNKIVRCFAKEFPGGPLTLPKLDDYALGIKRGRYYHAPTQLNGRPDSTSAALRLLNKVRTVILLDDSSSMALPGHSSWNFDENVTTETRWDQAIRMLSGIAPIVSQYNSHGIDLHFLNRSTFYTGLHTEAEVIEAFHAGRPNYTTPTGQRVNDILDGYMSTLRYYRDLMPLNLIVITDGMADDPNLLRWAIEEHITKIMDRGYPAHQLGIEFVQVGDSQAATDDLLALEEEVTRHHLSFNRDIVGITPITRIRNMNSELLLVISVGGIDARLKGYIRKLGSNSDFSWYL